MSVGAIALRNRRPVDRSPKTNSYGKKTPPDKTHNQVIHGERWDGHKEGGEETKKSKVQRKHSEQHRPTERQWEQ
jgi:hypothetical protein